MFKIKTVPRLNKKHVLQSDVFVSLFASVGFTTLNVHTLILMTASLIVRRERDAFELDTSCVTSEYV